VTGAWATLAAWVPALRTRVLWWATAAAQVTVFIQVGLGAALVGVEDMPAPQFHTFYGFLMIIAIGIIYSYRNQMRDRIYLLYGLGGLFVMGLGIRAMLLRT
jgi:hypothetical protein